MQKSNEGERRSGPLTLGLYVRDRRAERNLTLRQLADKTGISKSSLMRLEHGRFVAVVQKDADAVRSLWHALGGDFNQMLYLSRRCPVCKGVGTLREVV